MSFAFKGDIAYTCDPEYNEPCFFALNFRVNARRLGWDQFSKKPTGIRTQRYILPMSRSSIFHAAIVFSYLVKNFQNRS